MWHESIDKHLLISARKLARTAINAYLEEPIKTHRPLIISSGIHAPATGNHLHAAARPLVHRQPACGLIRHSGIPATSPPCPLPPAPCAPRPGRVCCPQAPARLLPVVHGRGRAPLLPTPDPASRMLLHKVRHYRCARDSGERGGAVSRPGSQSCGRVRARRSRRSSGAWTPSRSAWSGKAPVPKAHGEGIPVEGELEPVVVKLGVWLSSTKSRRNKITADQLAALTKLRVDWA